MSQRVFVAMSGGVDSAAAALLLRQAGYNVTGVTLRLHPYKDRPGLCGSADDIETARAVAAGMGIPHVVLDLCDLFRERVMDRFVWAYTHGRTPNPCIDCNREIKFGALLDWALDQGADAMATGHYARVRLDTPSGRWQLLLKNMAGQTNRACKFVSVICCAFPDGTELMARGECPGVLAQGPSGDGGFGYDPVFYLPQLGKTMAQLTPEEKNQISHRAQALAGFQIEWEKRHHGTDQ